ncbi:MAG: response regulator [Gammaproteobacteria bacterium]
MDIATERVLCVDDQIDIIKLLERQLGQHFHCDFATSGADALNMIDKSGPYAAIIADYSMPEMDGITLLGEIKKRSPDTIAIMLTAFSDIDVAIAALHKGNIFRFLRKPWEAEEVKKALSDALDQYRLIINERRLKNELAAANEALDAKVKELDETNRLLEYWVEFSPAVLYSLDTANAQLKPSYVSKNFQRLTGNERTAMIVDPDFWASIVHPDDKADLHKAREMVLHTDEDAVSAIYRVKCADGNYLSVVDSLRVVRNRAGEPLEIVGCWTSASDRIN